MLEVLTPSEMQRADELAVAGGILSPNLMENAGFAVADEITKRFKKCPVAVICGPGGNGGDGFVVARLLATRKWPVKAYLIGERSAVKGDAAVMAGKWKGAIGSFADFEASLGGKSGPRLIVDAIYGAGLNRAFSGYLADGIHGAGHPVVAIDVPSGLDGATGMPRGCSVAADVTVTFFRKKPAHLLQPGRRLCGEIVVADIGIPIDVLEQLDIRLGENSEPHLPFLHADTHKFRKGHAVIWSGPEFATGAARLAARGAARSGAGLTSIAGTSGALSVHANHVSSIMLKQVDDLAAWQELLRDKRITALCVGPGAGVTDGLREHVLAALASGIVTVLDADALSVFENQPRRLFDAISAKRERDVVLTPHEGEFTRLFGNLPGQPDSKHERARWAGRRSRAIIVLKGPDTVIAHPDGRARINANGAPKLATAGSGDVLAGVITGLLAQGMDAFEAASAGVWLHADAANRIPRRSIIAEDLLESLAT